MSVNQVMATDPARSKFERAPAWYRTKTRASILEAARDLIAREGLEKTSLMRVAHITGFAPTTVYAYFVKRSDLVLAIIADDLAAFARSMAGFYPFGESSNTAVDDADWTAQHPVNGDAQRFVSPVGVTPQIDIASDQADENLSQWERDQDRQGGDTQPASQPESGAARGAHVETQPASSDLPDLKEFLAALSELEARVAEIESQRNNSTLERRMNEFEQMLETIEARFAERETSPTQEAVEARLEEISGRLEQLEKKGEDNTDAQAIATVEQLEAQESAQRKSWGELRALVLEVSGRLEALERERELHALMGGGTAPAETSAALRAPAEPPPPVAVAANDADELPDLRHSTEIPQSAQEPADLRALTHEPLSISKEEGADSTVLNLAEPPSVEETESAADDSYLAAARRAALAAQSLAHTEDRGWKAKASSRSGSNRTTPALLAACVGLAIVVVGTNQVLKSRATSDRPAGLHRIDVARGGRSHAAAPIPVALASGAIGRAQSAEGLAYLNGDGVTKSLPQAARLLSIAAASGEPVAEYWLATLYEHGNGEPLNPVEATQLYQASAMKGNLKAMYKLAVAYAEGWGTPQNYSESARWFLRAADLGFINAQYNLGVLYERGLGVPQSLVDAYKWYALAAQQGDKVSAERVEILTSQLSADDLAAAREAVADFKPQERDQEANWLPGARPGPPKS